MVNQYDQMYARPIPGPGIKTYTQLRRFYTLEERFEYLKLNGRVGRETFGFDRYLNQTFYKSVLWRQARDFVIARDYGRDLGVEGYEIHDNILVHHMNPMKPEDITHSNTDILNPEYLITVSHNTHNAIHYGDVKLLPKTWVERLPGDTNLW